MLDGEPMAMKEHEAKCKICGISITLDISLNYPIEKDPRKIIPMATCNRCFDLRERRIRLENRFKRACYQLALEKTEGAKQLDSKAKELLVSLVELTCSQYSRWCADLLRRQHRANVRFLVDAILNQPDRWHNHLKDFESAANNA